ncbi:MAG TPA: VIT domain-containing protein [Polyangiaceae bacterium]
MTRKQSVRRGLRMIAVAAFAGLVGAVVVYIATRKPPPQAASAIQARLELAAGEVWVTQGETRVRAPSGTALMARAQIATEPGARALVQLPDGSRLFMREGSQLRLADDKVLLDQGEYWVDAAPTDRKPLVHDVDGVAVSGADAGMSVKRGKGEVTVYVARGMAIVSGAGGRVEVQAGEQATVKGKSEPLLQAVAFWDDWTGGMADLGTVALLPGAGSGTIYGVDAGAAPGAPAERLQIAKQAVQAVVRGGLSETRVDQTFFNPGERDVEGWYWFTVPSGASVTGFSVETDGVLVDGEFIEKKQAAQQYTAAKEGGHSPAILEYVDGSTYRARIYPVKAGATRRVVLRYLELRTVAGGKLEYLYPMGTGEPVRIGEFSLAVDLGDAGQKMKISTLADARVEEGGRRVTMRRSGYTPRASFQLEAALVEKRPPLTVARFSAGGESADYLLARYTPDVDWESVKGQRGDVVVVVDTSAAGDEASRQLKTATAEAILRALSDSDRFALVSLDVKPTVLHPQKGLAKAADSEISRALEALAEHAAGGATDLAALFDVSLSRLHGAEQPAVIYVGDGLATSGELSGEQLNERLRRALSTSRARLFTVGVGSDADHALLGELARSGGGESFRVGGPDETTARALEIAASLKVPTITDLEIDLGAGLDEAFASADRKLTKGSELVVLARTHHSLPSRVKVSGRLGGETFSKEYPTKSDDGVVNALVPKLWAAEYVRRLLGGAGGPDAERGRVVALGIEYGLMTPFTSILALESEAAFATMGIQRNYSPLRGVRLTALEPLLERRLESSWVPAPAGVAFGCALSREAPDEEMAQVAAPLERAAPPTVAAAPPVATNAAETKPGEGTAEAPPQGPAAAAAPAEPEAEKAEAKLSDDEPSPALGGGVAAKDPGVASVARSAAPRRAKQAAGADDDRPAPVAKGGGVSAHSGWSAPVALGTCSDAARRPLPQRVLLWKQRLKVADGPDALAQRYLAARRACELDDWRAERTFLALMQARVADAAAARQVLGMFDDRPEVKKHLARLILRRSVDENIVQAIEETLFGRAVDWNLVDLELQAAETPEARLELLRQAIARAPEDPNGDIRLVGALVEAGKRDQAVAVGRRLRDQGLMTPSIAQRLGDALAVAGFRDEAVRTYSEIVEFDAASTGSRRLLGDIFLGHAWYEPAYRQYRTLTEQSPGDALAWLRLAAAAAGVGRIDEALRLERKVASGQGTPGPSDPRLWARLQSALRLANLLSDGKQAAARASVKRKLKELQLFSGPGELSILSWEKLDRDLVLVSLVDGKDEARGEATDAAPAGLSARLMTLSDAAEVELVARLRSAPGQSALALELTRITWDGKDFEVEVEPAKLAARTTLATL